MKKLALALVCLMGVAFLSSCDPVVENPEPSIAIIAEEGYLYDGQVIEMGVSYPFGFFATSNVQTGKELAKLVITCNGDVICDSVISGSTFTYRDEIYFTDEEDSREIVGSAEFIATVTDAAGQVKKASFKVDVNKEDNLVVTPIEWIRANGADGTGLAEFGLQWTKNVSSRFLAVIEPIPGEKVTMYSVPAEKWDEVVTATDKAALFSDGGVATVIDDYRGINVDYTQEYDVVIATLYQNEYHLIHLTKCTVEQRYYVFTITGEAK